MKNYLKDLLLKLEIILNDNLLPLKPRDKDIILSRFSFDHQNFLTLEQLGTKYNLSRERVRVIQNQITARTVAPRLFDQESIRRFKKTFSKTSINDAQEQIFTLGVSPPLTIFLLTHLIRLLEKSLPNLRRARKNAIIAYKKTRKLNAGYIRLVPTRNTIQHGARKL